MTTPKLPLRMRSQSETKWPAHKYLSTSQTQKPPQTLPLFFLQSWPETEKAWQDLIAAREKMLALPIVVLLKL